MQIELPEYARVNVTFYVVSPSTGLQAAINASGARRLNDEALPSGISAAIDALNGLGEVSDARPMTAPEVANYIADQKEGACQGALIASLEEMIDAYGSDDGHGPVAIIERAKAAIVAASAA